MPELVSGEPRYPVRVVTARTGVSADVLRAWERRYGAVRPHRSPGGQRLYTEEDVARLALLRRATLAGHGIANVARLDRPSLEALLGEPTRSANGEAPDGEAALVAASLAATERLDRAALEAALRRGALTFGAAAMVDRVVSRFLRRVGERWHEGTLSPAHEHLASTVVREVLAWLSGAHAAGAAAPRIAVATPAGELHEFGAMLVAAAAAEEGWRVTYLGPNLPAAHLAAAAAQVDAHAVALSVVHADGRPVLDDVLETGRALPAGTALLVGGAAAELHRDALREAGARVLADIPALRRTLRALDAAPRSRG